MRKTFLNSSEAGYRRKAVFVTLAIGIGPAATNLFLRELTWALNPSRVLAPSRESSPGWANNHLVHGLELAAFDDRHPHGSSDVRAVGHHEELIPLEGLHTG